MPIVTVTKHDTSQNNKARIYFDNHHDWKDAYYVKQGIYLPADGQLIDADTSSQEFRPGRVIWFLNSWKYVKTDHILGAAQQHTGHGGATNMPNSDVPVVNAPAKALAGWDIQSGDLSRYASNIVASAITAGLIKQPSDIAVWSKAAYRAGEALKAGDMQGPDPSIHAGDPGREDGDPGFDGRDVPF